MRNPGERRSAHAPPFAIKICQACSWTTCVDLEREPRGRKRARRARRSACKRAAHHPAHLGGVSRIMCASGPMTTCVNNTGAGPGWRQLHRPPASADTVIAWSSSRGIPVRGRGDSSSRRDDPQRRRRRECLRRARDWATATRCRRPRRDDAPAHHRGGRAPPAPHGPLHVPGAGRVTRRW